MKAVGRDEVHGLKLPVGEGAIDHFEAQRDPLDGFERAALDGLDRGGRILDAGAKRRAPAARSYGRVWLTPSRPVPIFITISGSIFGENIRRDSERRVFVAA